MSGLLLVVLVNFIGVGALIPVLPYAVLDEAGADEVVMAALLASFAFAMFVGAPVLGRLSDYIGRRRVLIGSVLLAAVGHCWFAFTSDITVMFLARLLAGFGSGNIGVIQAIITDTTDDAGRARAMGLLGACVGLGFVAGPALGGLLSGAGGMVHTAPFLLAAGLSVVGFLLTLFQVRETAPAQSAETVSSGKFLRRLQGLFASGFGLFALANFFLNLSFAQIEASYILVLKEVLGYSSFQTGWVFTWIGVLIIIVQGMLIGPVTRRLTDIRTATAGSALLMIGQFLSMVMIGSGFLLFGEPLFGLLVSTSCVCIGFAFTNPTLVSAASKQARHGAVGGQLGIVQGFGSLGQVFGLAVAGPLYAYGGGGLNFMVGGCLSLILFGLFIWICRIVSPSISTAEHHH